MKNQNTNLKIKELENENRTLKCTLMKCKKERYELKELLEKRTQELYKRNQELLNKGNQLKEINTKYKFLSRHDYLTNLPNRMYLNEIVDGILSGEATEIFCFIFIDVDRFKNINDTYGHDVGDILLTKIADRLKRCVRENDMVSRFGGDEFVIIIKNCYDRGNIKGICKKIIENMKEPFIISENKCTVGASIGVSFYPEDGDTMEVLLNKADAAMYHIKKEKANGYVFFNDISPLK